MNNVKRLIQRFNLKKLKCTKLELRNYLKLLVRNPNWEFNEEMLIEYCTQQITKNTFEFKLFCLQNYMHTEFFLKNKEIIAKEMQNIYEKKFEYLLKILLKNDSFDNFVNYLTLFIIMRNGLGDPMNKNVFEITLAALESAIQKEDFEIFFIANNTKKLNMINNFEYIITGIRLFNKMHHQISEGIKNLPLIEKNALSTIKTIVSKKLVEINEQIDLYTNTIKSSLINEQKLQLPTDLDINNLDYLKMTLISLWQTAKYLLIFLDEVKNLETDLEKINDELNSICEQIKNIIAESLEADILASNIFPWFSNLTKAWYKIRENILFIIKINKLIEIINDFIAKNIILLKNDELDIEINEKMSSLTFDIFKFEFIGMCLWSFIKSKGILLIQGDEQYGLISYYDMNFKCSSLESFYKFEFDPNKIIQKALELINKSPNIISLLEIDFEKFSKINFKQIEKKPEMKNVEQQTELHPVNKFIDNNYKWNVWDMKREALTITYLTNCITNSTQTQKSSRRAEILTQTYPLRDNETQTTKTKWTCKNFEKI